MFVGSGIQGLVDFMHRREASLWHACQLIDLAAYLALGGIPSRSLVERRGLAQTAFVTDTVDRRNGVWDKVFLNLDDFGRSFAAGYRAVPNPYGPIALQVRPEALLAATDVAVALRSAGAHDFDRAGESLSNVEEIDRIYRHPVHAGFPLSADTRFGEELRRAFKGSLIEAKAAEVSVSIAGQLLSLSFVSMVRVEPFEVRDVELDRIVRTLLKEFGVDVAVRPRLMGERANVWRDLVSWLSDGPLPLTWLLNRSDASDSTRRWMLAIQERDLGWQFDRFATYLYEGTLRPLLATRVRNTEMDVEPYSAAEEPSSGHSASISDFRRNG